MTGIYVQTPEISTKLSFIAEIPDSQIFECLPRTCQYLKLARQLHFKGFIMKKTLIAIIAAAFFSVPSLFAFHDLETNHLVSGMPVLFIVTGPKFPPAKHDAVKTYIEKWYSSDCFMSLQNTVDATVDSEGKATLIMRWATKEAYMHDRKKMTPELCGELKNLRMNTVKLGGIKPTDMKMTLVTSIASSPR